MLAIILRKIQLLSILRYIIYNMNMVNNQYGFKVKVVKIYLPLLMHLN